MSSRYLELRDALRGNTKVQFHNVIIRAQQNIVRLIHITNQLVFKVSKNSINHVDDFASCKDTC